MSKKGSRPNLRRKWENFFNSGPTPSAKGLKAALPMAAIKWARIKKNEAKTIVLKTAEDEFFCVEDRKSW